MVRDIQPVAPVPAIRVQHVDVKLACQKAVAVPGNVAVHDSTQEVEAGQRGDWENSERAEL